MVDLTDNLMPKDSPIDVNNPQTTGFSFDAENEAGVISSAKMRNASIVHAKIGTAAIGTANIGTLTFNEIEGGTARLGGTANGDGVLQIRNALGTVIVQGDNLGHHYYGTAGTQELIKVDSSGLHAYGTNAVEFVKVDSLAFHAYNTAGSESFQIGTAGVIGFGTAANVFSLRQYVGGQEYGRLGYGTAAGMWVIGTPALYLEGLNNLNLLSDTYSNFALSSGTAAIAMGALNGGISIKAHNDINLICSNFVLNGSTKTAIVPSSKGYRALYTNESPEVWFMDFCDSKDTIDPLFLEVTEPPYHFIKCEGGEYQVWGKRKGMKNVRFEEKTKEQFIKNNAFWSIPHE